MAGISRASAQTVLFFDEDTATYGGTPSDHTVVQLCAKLKARGLNVMLYPMPFVDTITPVPKPWRGRIVPANATDAASWFTKTNGYNAFIMHYANLMSGKVDAFVIGSELIGMTGFTDTPGSYPAVAQLVSLAASVKSAMPGTLITYAADWSEYHSLGGWFNLDPLWSSSNIDFVGIDSYFPLTPDLPQLQIIPELIAEYWESGEGWDYYYTDSVARTGQTSYSGDPTYAWKNLEYWWKNTHTNPDTSTTGWTAKMKPIWFTEFGFPSVDGCTNQPNVFYDPTSSENFYPRASKGRVDFQAQRVALDTTLDYLEARETASGNTGLVARRFIWTWDARPFSFWPDLKGVWQDSILWATGHWVNGKLGASTLGAVVAELLQAAGLTPSDYDVTRLTASLEGFILQQPITVRNALEQLASGFFFDVVESDGILKCVPRGNESVKSIPEDDLIPSAKSGVQDVLEINYAHVRIEPTDVITVIVSGVAHEMRVIKTDMESNGLMKISAVAEDVSSYDFYTPAGETSRNITPPVLVPDTLLQFVDAPPLPTDTVPNQGLLRFGVAPDGADWNGAAIYRSDDGGEDGGNTFNLLAGLEGAATFGVIITNLPAGITETWDQVNKVEVLLTSGSLASVSELAVFNGANPALIGDELVQFQNAELIGERTYRLSRLLRGRQGTEWAVGSHSAGDRFILLSPALYGTAIANNLIGRQLFYKGVSVGNSLGNTDEVTFTYTGRNLKPFAPVHVKGVRDGSGNLSISWIRRSRVDAEWRDGVGIPLGEESELYEVEILDGSTVVRTIGATSPSASYSAAVQTTNFGSPQSSISVKVYQLSVVVGRGYATNASI